MTNIVIFSSGDITQFLARLKIGTPNLLFIDGDIITKEIIDDITLKYPKQVDHTVILRREKLSNEAMRDKTIELIVIDTTKAGETALAVYEKSALMYSETREILRLEVTNHYPSTIPDSTKEYYLVSGAKKFELVDKLLVKGCDSAHSIRDEVVNVADGKAIAAVNSQTLTLVTVNAVIFNSENYSRHAWLGTSTGYSVECIKILPNAGEEIEEVVEKKLEDNSTTISTNMFPSIEDLAAKHKLIMKKKEKPEEFKIRVLAKELNIESKLFGGYPKEEVIKQAKAKKLIPEVDITTTT